MADHVGWRFHIAERVASHYALNPEVEAVALIGSVALGWADAYSDIELAVFWRSEPDAERRHMIADELGAADWHPSEYSTDIQAWCEDYKYYGVKIDLGRWLTSTMDDIITDVVVRCDANLSRQMSVSAIGTAVPLQGNAIVRRWQERATIYPADLAEEMVRQHLNFNPAWMLRMLAQRDDYPLVRRNLTALSYKLFTILCGLNRKYYPGHKWLPYHLRMMEILPTDFLERLPAALAAPLPQAVSEFESMIEDVMALVEAHLPHVDTLPVRSRFEEIPPNTEHPPKTLTTS